MTKRICVVGTGRWGQNHLRSLDSIGCLAGAVESSRERRDEFAKKYPKVEFFSDIDEALAKGFDGYTVATPAETHFMIAQKILKAKQHLLVEKPIALNSKDAKALDVLAKQNKCLLMVGHVLLFHPAIQKIKELISIGKLGKLQYLYSNRLNLGTVRKEENILWSFAPHDISIFQYLIGGLPTHVRSGGGAFVQPHIHDSTMTFLEYQNNIKGHIFVSWLHPFKEHRFVVIGSKGMLSFEDNTQEKQLVYFEKGIDWVNGEPVKRDGPTEVVEYDKKMPLQEELQYFVDCIGGKKLELADSTSAVEVLSILEDASKDLLVEDGSAHQDTGTKEVRDIGQQKFFKHDTSIVGENAKIGENSKIWHFSHVQDGCEVGKNTTIGQNVFVASNVKIGSNVKIQNNVSVYEGVELEDYVFCGPSMVFTNVLEPRCKYPQRGSEFYKKTLVKEGASIGANATIVCGNTVGKHAFIAAGAVVTKNVPDFALVVGVPGKVTGWVCECGEKLDTDSKNITCSCGYSYKLIDNRITQSTKANLEQKKTANS